MEIRVGQLDAERFEVRLLPAGSVHEVELPRHTRQGLGLHGVPPTRVVQEAVAFLLERVPPEALPAAFSLPRLAGRYPEFPEELRGRLA